MTNLNEAQMTMRPTRYLDLTSKLGTRAALLALGVVGVGVLAGCDKPKASVAAPPPAEAPATAVAKKEAAPPAEEEPPAKKVTPLCLKFNDDVAKATGQGDH